MCLPIRLISQRDTHTHTQFIGTVTDIEHPECPPAKNETPVHTVLSLPKGVRFWTVQMTLSVLLYYSESFQLTTYAIWKSVYINRLSQCLPHGDDILIWRIFRLGCWEF